LSYWIYGKWRKEGSRSPVIVRHEPAIKPEEQKMVDEMTEYIFVCFHAVEEKDWPRYEEFKGKYRDEMVALARKICCERLLFTGYLHLHEYVESFFKHADERNVAEAYRDIIYMLFGLPPYVPTHIAEAAALFGLPYHEGRRR